MFGFYDVYFYKDEQDGKYYVVGINKFGDFRQLGSAYTSKKSAAETVRSYGCSGVERTMIGTKKGGKEMKTVKLFDAIDLTIDGETERFESPVELWEAMRIDGDDYKECRVSVLQNLICNGGFLDLSETYRPHNVSLKIVPCSKEG